MYVMFCSKVHSLSTFYIHGEGVAVRAKVQENANKPPLSCLNILSHLVNFCLSYLLTVSLD